MYRFALLGLLAVASCSDAVDPAVAKVDVETLVKVYHEAYDRADADAVVAMLDPDVTISDPPQGFIKGKVACGEHLKKGMERLRQKGLAGKRATLFGPIHVEVAGICAVATYVAMVREDRDQANTIFTRVFRRRDGKWLILAEHFTFEPVR
jgi:ketosteroid isomerase-like protein